MGAESLTCKRRPRPAAKQRRLGAVQSSRSMGQQGFDMPQDKPVAVARDCGPQGLGGQSYHPALRRRPRRHAYWLNGRALGFSENLFTPVEWDVTDVARPGLTNRLDLEMRVTTVSEALSYSSAYAFHNLGGIDRSVRVFALPPIHVREMRLNTDIDNDYRDGCSACTCCSTAGACRTRTSLALSNCMTRLARRSNSHWHLQPSNLSVALRPLISKSTFPTPFTGAPRNRASTRSASNCVGGGRHRAYPAKHRLPEDRDSRQPTLY